MERQRYETVSFSGYGPPEWLGRPAAAEDEDLRLVDPSLDAPLTDICLICHHNMRRCILSLKYIDTEANVEHQMAESLRDIRKSLEEDYYRLGLWISDSGVSKGSEYLRLGPNLEGPLHIAFEAIDSELFIMKAEIDGLGESESISDVHLSLDAAGQAITRNIHIIANMQSLIHNAQAIQLKDGPKADLQLQIDYVFENYVESGKNLEPLEDSTIGDYSTYLTKDHSLRNSINQQCEYCQKWFRFGALELHQELRHGRKETDLMTSSVPSPEATVKPAVETKIFRELDSDDEIRLLKVLRGKRNEPIRCILYTVALSSIENAYSTVLEEYDYDALSYCWGDDLASRKITLFSFVKDEKGSLYSLKNLKRATIYVRSNLEAALRQIRSEGFDRNVWVDAICINRANEKEAYTQVGNIPTIFSKAKKVVIWLGVEDPQAEKTFNLLQDILDLKKLDMLVGLTESPEKWKLILRLLENKWFSRRWVIQEVVFAKAAILYWGSKSILWSSFTTALTLLVHKKEDIYRTLDRIVEYPDILHPLGVALTQHAEMISNAAYYLLKRSTDGKMQPNLLPLEYLITSLLIALEVSDQRDTIYALLSIAKDTSAIRPFSISKGTKTQPLIDSRVAPDYHKGLLDVYTDFVDYCVDTSNSLDIICRHWAPISERGRMSLKILASTEDWEEIPSWIQSIQGHAFGSLTDWRKGRVNGDSFVDSIRIPYRQTYSASAGLQPHISFGKLKFSEENPVKISQMKSSSTAEANRGMSALPQYFQPLSRKFDGTLYIKGHRLCEIAKVTGRISQGMIQQEAFKMGGWPLSSDPENVPDQLWRTIVADRGPKGTHAPSWYRPACVECLKHVDGNGDLNTNALKALKGTPDMLVNFLERVQQVIWNRRFFRATGGIKGDQNSLFGLVPANANAKDIICIMFGCSVPVVLRHHRTAEGSHFKLVGECYVYEYMEGEAIDSRNRPAYPYNEAETFNLR